MDLLGDLQMLLLNFSLVMIYIIHKMLALLTDHLNYLKDNIFGGFLKKYDKLLFFLKKVCIRPEEEKIIKNIRNLLRLEKEIKELKIIKIEKLKIFYKTNVLKSFKSFKIK